MARKLVVEIVGDASSLDRSLKEATVASNRFGKEVSHSLRGVASGTGIMHGFGRSLAFASGGFLAFEGVSRFLEESIKAGQGAVVTQRSLAAQMKTSGESFKANQEAIDKAGLSLARFGFTSENADQALVVLDRATGNISQSQKLLTVSADLARAKNIDLAQAANVVAKVFGGQTTALRRAVPGLDRNAKGWDLIREAQARLAGQARAATTPQEKFAAELFNTEKIVGTALLPTFNKYLGELSRWLEAMTRSGKLQRDVNGAVGAVKSVISAATGAFRAFNSVTGSTGDTLKVLFGAFAAFKTLKLVSWFDGVTKGLGGVATASETATTEAATLGTGLSALTLAPYVITIAVAYKDLKDPGSILDRAKGLFDFVKKGSPLERALENLPNIGPLAQGIRQGVGAFGRGGGQAGGNLFSPGFRLPGFGLPAPPFVPHDLPTSQAALPIVGRGGLTAMQANALALSAAGRTKTTKDDLAALVTQRVLLAKAITTETARLNQATSAQAAKKFADNLQKLQDRDAAAFNQIVSITKKGAADAGKTANELAAQRNTFFDNAITRMLDRVQDVASAGGKIAALQKVNALITKRIAVTKDITRKLRLEDQVTANLREIAADRVQQQQDVIDALSLNVDRAGLTKTVSDDIAALQAVNAGLANQNRLYGITKEREQQIVANLQQIQGYRQQQKDAQQQARATRKQAAENARQTALDWAQLAVDRAQTTKTFTDDLRTERALEALIRRQIAAAGLTAARARELLDARQKITDTLTSRREAQQAAAQKARDASTARQFRAIGLTAAGAEPTPGGRLLQQRLAGIRRQVEQADLAGTGLNKSKVLGRLDEFGKLFVQGVDNIKQPVRAAIDSFYDTVNSALDKGSKGTLKVFQHASAANIVASLGGDLTRAQRLRLETAIRGIGPGLTVPSGQSLAFSAGHTTVINGGVHLHDVQNVPAFENELVKRSQARGHVRRGSR